VAATSSATNADRAQRSPLDAEPSLADAGASVVQERPPVRRITQWNADRSASGSARIAAAERARLGTVQELFGQAGLGFPPAALLFRAFKQDMRLEVWAQSKPTDPWVHVTTYEICYGSGGLGPKRKQGDRQVPEGFYTINYFNPATPYHLGMQVSYPNSSDRILGDPHDPGSEIMIHGDCVSVGCLAMSDERSEELWLMATTVVQKVGGKVHVHIFPARDMAALLASGQYPAMREFWENLKEGLDYFNAKRALPRIAVDSHGRYLFK